MSTTPAPTALDTDSTGVAPRRSRRFGKLAAKAALVGGGLAVGIGGGAAYAATFSDVPASHPFYDEIEWMAETGITQGFEDGTFRPNDEVTRGQMSAFMQRLYLLQDTTYAANMSGAQSTESSSWQNVMPLVAEVTVPEGTRANLHALLTAESSCTDGAGYCRARIVYQPVGGGAVTELGPVVGSQFAFDNSNGNTEPEGSWESHSMSRSSAASLPPGEYNVGVQISTSTNGSTHFYLDDANLQVDVDLVPEEDLPIVLELG
jgi:hypothetical protein